MSHQSQSLGGFSMPSTSLKREEEAETEDRQSAFPLAPFISSKAPPMTHNQLMRSPTLATPAVPPLRTLSATRGHTAYQSTAPPGNWTLTSDALVRPVLPRLAGGLSSLHVTSHQSPPSRHAESVPSPRSSRRSKIDYNRGLKTSHTQPPLSLTYTSSPSLPDETINTSPHSEYNNSDHFKPTKTARRREQCRANQARYRERQKLKLARAEEEVACLRETIGLLEVQRSAARAYFYPEPGYARHITTSLFRRLRRGLSGANYDTELKLTSGEWIDVGRAGRNLSLLKQIAYIRCVTSSDIELGSDLRGPNDLLEQFWRYSVLFTNFRLELVAINPLVASSSQGERVMATVRIHVGVTERTLEAVFPDLEGHLRRKLFGQTLVLSVNFDLEFEKIGGSLLMQLTRMVPQTDLAEALMGHLHSLRDVEEVLRCAQFTAAGWIRGVSRFP